MPGKKEKPTPFGLTEDWETALADWSVFNGKHILAHAGGWRDQPADWRENMITLNDMYADEFEALRKSRR